MENWIEHTTQLIASYVPQVVGALLILILGRIAAGICRSLLKAALGRARAEATIVNFVGNIAYWAVLVFTVIAALSKFGVETASFVAILGAVSFAIGFALQGSLANFAAGVMILIFRPFKPGDFIDAAGITGTVKSIDLFATIVTTGDNVKIIVPNGKLFGDTIKNFSAFDTRRVDLLIGIGYGSSIEKALQVLQDLCEVDGRIHTDPEPMMAVSELADSSVNLILRVWVDSGDYWGVKFDLTRRIKDAFDENGIDIPYPQQVVHMLNAPSA